MQRAAGVTLVRDRRGGSFAEYLILVALLGVALLAGWGLWSGSVDSKSQQYGGCIESMSACVPMGEAPSYLGAATPPGGTTDPGGGTTGGGDDGGDGGDDGNGGKAWYEYPWEAVKGLFVDGLWGDVTGIWDMVTSPIETGKGLLKLAWMTSPIGLAVDPGAREDLAAMTSAIWDASYEYVTEHPDRAVGRAIYEIGTFFIAPAKLLKVGQVTKATKVVKVVDTLDQVNDLRRLIDNADEVAKARRWADEYLAANKAVPDPAFAARKLQIQDAWTKVKNGELRLPESFLPGLTDQQKIERLKLAMEGDPARGGQRLPLTFKNWDQYDRFKSDLEAVLRKNGIDDATVQQIGSGTQGWKGNPTKGDIFLPDGQLNPKAMWTPESDTDFAVFSDKAVTQGKAIDAQIKTEYGTFKNGTDEFGPGFHETPLGKDLKELSKRWNEEIYGVRERDGFDFKINLGGKPFQTSPTISTPTGSRPVSSPTLGAPSKADEAESVLHGDDGDD